MAGWRDDAVLDDDAEDADLLGREADSRARPLEFDLPRCAREDVAAGLARLVAEAPASSLPDLIGALAQAHALALARLVAPAPERHGPEDALLAMPEVARRLGVTEYQAREMGRRGELPTILVGERRVRVRAGALEEWIRRRESGRSIDGRGSR
jgi:excisionase family DNA binding protein